MSSDAKGKGKEVMEWCGEGCAACQHLQRACGPECVFAPHFPAGDDPATFAMVDARFGADRVALILCGLSPEQQAEAVLKFVRKAQQPGAAAAVAPAQSRPPCAACKHLRQACEPNCVYRPYYPPDDDPERFARAYKVYEGVMSVYEARRRQHDPVPVHGVASNVPILETALEMLKEKYAARLEELARYGGEEAASRFSLPAYETRPLPEMTDQEVQANVQVIAHQVTLQSASDAVAGVTTYVTPLHEMMVKAMTPYVPGGSTGVAAEVPGAAQSSTDIHVQQQQQQQPSETPKAITGVQDPGFPEGGEDPGDEPSEGSV